MKKNVRTALFFVVPGLLMTFWYAYVRTKEEDKLSAVPPPNTNKLHSLNKLLDHF